MRIAIYGAGAVGGYYGGRLAQAGHDVIFIARGENLRALQTSGLHVNSTFGDFHIHPVQAVSDPAGVGIVDLVIPGVKTWSLPDILAGMAALVGPQTTIVTIQNGVDSHEVIGAALGREHVIAGITRLFSRLVEPGHIVHAAGNAQFLIGELDGQDTQRIQAIYQMLRSTYGVTAEVTAEIQSELWAKLVMAASYGGVGSLLRAPMGVLRSLPEARALLIASMEEIMAVAAARGYPLSTEVIDRTMAYFESRPAYGTSSMQRDIFNGRRSEMESLIGSVVRYARECGVPVPVNQVVYASLLPRELKARGELAYEI